MRDVRDAGTCREAPENPGTTKNGHQFRDAKDSLPPAGLYCIATSAIGGCATIKQSKLQKTLAQLLAQQA